MPSRNKRHSLITYNLAAPSARQLLEEEIEQEEAGGPPQRKQQQQARQASRSRTPAFALKPPPTSSAPACSGQQQQQVVDGLMELTGGRLGRARVARVLCKHGGDVGMAVEELLACCAPSAPATANATAPGPPGVAGRCLLGWVVGRGVRLTG